MKMVKLEKLVNSVLPKFQKELQVQSLELKVPTQMDLPKIPTLSKRAVAMGRYYEFMTRGFFGGVLSDLKYLEAQDNENHHNHFSIPDVTNHEEGVLWESKACCSGHSCNLLDSQIEGYKSRQLDEPDLRIFFVVYRHVLRGIKSTYKGSERELFEELNKKTMLALVLPFSLVLGLHEPIHEENPHWSRLCYMYEEKEGIGRTDGKHHYFGSCTYIRSPTLNRFLTEPEEVIQEIGYDVSAFNIKRRITPEGLRVNKNPVRQFPVVLISDVNHEQWFKGFKYDCQRRTEEEDGETPF